jgi:hypothetical protein
MCFSAERGGLCKLKGSLLLFTSGLADETTMSHSSPLMPFELFISEGVSALSMFLRSWHPNRVSTVVANA